MSVPAQKRGVRSTESERKAGKGLLRSGSIEETGRASLNNTNEKPQKEKAATRQDFFHFDDPNAFLDFC